jgi:hypothetical protein
MTMNKRVTLGAVGCLLFCLSACDRADPTIPFKPVNPVKQAKEQPGVTAPGIVVTSSRRSYFIGSMDTFTASMKRSDGSTILITGGNWASDTPGVAMVNEAGSVTIVGQGWANISCAYGGMIGSKQVWGRVDCRGTWSGTYGIEKCQAWEDFLAARFCETHGGSGLNVGLVLAEEGETLRGTITLENLSTPFVAKPLLDGSLEMEGRVFSDPYEIDVAIGCDWTGSEPIFCMMLYYTAGGLSGRAMLTCSISLTKTSAGQ